MRILLVEDSDDLADEVAEVLRRLGHDVVIHSGTALDEVLACFVGRAFELVLVDLGLPGFDGAALVDALANAEDPPAIIVCTGSSEGAIAPLRSKIDGLLRKPLGIEDLGAAVSRVAERRGKLAPP
jgi:DNA-binding response OmpR family regulator